MKKRMTYRLLAQSEEKLILETAVYALLALSALTAIWQFADEPAIGNSRTGTVIQQSAERKLAS